MSPFHGYSRVYDRRHVSRCQSKHLLRRFAINEVFPYYSKKELLFLRMLRQGAHRLKAAQRPSSKIVSARFQRADPPTLGSIAVHDGGGSPGSECRSRDHARTTNKTVLSSPARMPGFFMRSCAGALVTGLMRYTTGKGRAKTTQSMKTPRLEPARGGSSLHGPIVWFRAASGTARGTGRSCGPAASAGWRQVVTTAFAKLCQTVPFLPKCHMAGRIKQQATNHSWPTILPKSVFAKVTIE